MPKSVPVMTRVDPATKAKLRRLAKSTKRSESFLAKEAIEAFISVNEWQLREISQGLEEVNRGTPGVPHEQVAEWLQSWGTDQETPPPEPERHS